MTTDQLLLDELRAQHDRLVRHLDAVDAKAGITIGFAGVLAVVAPAAGAAVDTVGRSLAMLAAILALVAFVPRRLYEPDPGSLSPTILGDDPAAAAARLRLLLVG